MPSRVPDVLSRSRRSRSGQGAQTFHEASKIALNTVWTVSGKVHSLSTTNDSSSTTRSDVASQLVVEVLHKIEGTDRGAEAPEDLQNEVENLLEKLEDLGQAQVPRPLENPLIFGNYDVAYVSTRGAPKQDGQPAGGRFRSRFGRSLFRTEKVCQSVIQPDIVTNKVEFSLFGLVPGHVGLRGKLEQVDGDKDTVKVLFEKPELCLGGLSLRIGPPSSVILKTSYLDEAVRLGKGSRGSKFVFVRGGEAESAGMEEVGRSQTKWWGVSWVIGSFMGLWWFATVLLRRQVGRVQLLGPLAVLMFALSFVGSWREKTLSTAC
ncbi:probable plastid-lipid-associated protein 8, chloroplastic [Coccomyxa sp. Obi]|nr:probable plastid-lipid-associated protein 8, chloroplastic [Coccomyxa sp. Obi]